MQLSSSYDLHCVTCTGADDGTSIADMASLSERFPFIEWGILFSPSRVGTPRYPSLKWVAALTDVAIKCSMSLSAHLCGAYSRDALAANWSWQRALGGASWAFGRVQINCGHNPEPAIGSLIREWPTSQRVIIQSSNKNRHWVEGMCEDHPNTFNVLFDDSGGRGELARAWPFAIDRTLCGYAGGLGPLNVADELVSIKAASLGHPFWIDMESKVRNANDEFDLTAVAEVMRSCGHTKQTLQNDPVER